jgi:hypothetical protein
MCNDFGNNIPYSDYLAAFSQIRAPVVFPTAAPNLEPRDDIWSTEPAPVFRRREHGSDPGERRVLNIKWAAVGSFGLAAIVAAAAEALGSGFQLRENSAAALGNAFAGAAVSRGSEHRRQ